MSLAEDLEKVAASNIGVGALGGAGLGLLLQALRPKDKDQNAWEEYLMSALLGAGLGAASGYGYDVISGNTGDPPEKTVGSKILAKRGVTIPTYKWVVKDPGLLSDLAKLDASGTRYGIFRDEYIKDVPEYDDNGNLIPGQGFVITRPWIGKQYSGLTRDEVAPMMDAADKEMIGVTGSGNTVWPGLSYQHSDGSWSIVPDTRSGPLHPGW